MASNYYVFHLFSKIMEDNKVERIIELGTGKGSMSIVLALEAVKKGIEFITYDIKEQTTFETQRMLNKLDAKRRVCDIFENSDEIFSLFDKPVFLLCDNGNKRKEIEMFAPSLMDGSVVSVHDYGIEFTAKDAKRYDHILTPYKISLWRKHNVQLATWIKR